MATAEPKYSPSGLLQYLPAVYAEDPFLGQYLLAFEKILLGRVPPPDAAKSDPSLNPKGLEEIIDGLAKLYDPIETPADFLPWLSQWVALSLRADMTLEQQQKFVAQVIQLYGARGTEQNLEKLLGLFLSATPTVEVLDTDPPYFFHVTVKLPERTSPEFTRRQFEIAQALIELEKPAHTDYTLLLKTPSLRVGDREGSVVGVNTLLGTAD